MRSFTSSLDPIYILSSLFWKEGEKKREKNEKKRRKKSQRKKRRERKKSVRKKERRKKLDLSRINLVPEFGLESVLRTVQ